MYTLVAVVRDPSDPEARTTQVRGEGSTYQDAHDQLAAQVPANMQILHVLWETT